MPIAVGFPVLMNVFHDHGAFSDGGSEALDRSFTHVTGDKDAWHAGLETIRFPLQLPFGPL
jgi:hypothetical protein